MKLQLAHLTLKPVTQELAYEALVFELLFIDGFGHCEVVTNPGSARTVSVVFQLSITGSKDGGKGRLFLNAVRLNIDISCLDHATRS